MVIIARFTNYPGLCQSGNCLYTISRCYASKLPWNYLWKPGKYPTTEEERRKAAEKYGLHPAEYEPYDTHKDGISLGDYPKLPAISAEARDPFQAWDYPEARRNFNEPIHINENIMGLDRYDYYGVQEKFSFPTMLAVFLGVIGTFAALAVYFEDKPDFRPVMEKQFPKAGVVHYTFEPAN